MYVHVSELRNNDDYVDAILTCVKWTPHCDSTFLTVSIKQNYQIHLKICFIRNTQRNTFYLVQWYMWLHGPVYSCIPWDYVTNELPSKGSWQVSELPRVVMNDRLLQDVPQTNWHVWKDVWLYLLRYNIYLIQILLDNKIELWKETNITSNIFLYQYWSGIYMKKWLYDHIYIVDDGSPALYGVLDHCIQWPRQSFTITKSIDFVSPVTSDCHMAYWSSTIYRESY